MALTLSGKEVSTALAQKIETSIDLLQVRSITPKLAIVRVGERADDLSYERTAINRAKALGIETQIFALNEDASQDEVTQAIYSINEDKLINGCLIFRPLPAHLDEKTICDLLASEKDVDGISSASLAAVYADRNDGFPPCTAAACLEILDHYNIPLEGKSVVVIGRSLVIGKPFSMMALKRNATVTICHSRSNDLAELTQRADIVVCATGRARAYGPNFFRSGQTVIDVGINFDSDGNLCGDVDFAKVEPIVGAITPVPGGSGSVTTSVLMEHTVQAAINQNF